MYSGASVGIAHLESYYRSADEVLRDADAAMYQAKPWGAADLWCLIRACAIAWLKSLNLKTSLGVRYVKKSSTTFTACNWFER